MPSVDPLAVRVVHRYVAQVRADRLAREVQRRSEGLVTVRKQDGDNDGDGIDAGDEATSEPGTARRSSP